MNSINQIGHVSTSNLFAVQQIQKANAFFQAWKQAIKTIDPVFFLNDSLSIDDSICTMDLKPNIEVIKSQISSLNRQEQQFICVLVSFYDYEAANAISREIGFEFSRDAVSFDNHQKELIRKMKENFISSDDFWGDFNTHS